MPDTKMAELADILGDEDTVVRGYIAVSGVKLMGHKYMGQDRTMALNFRCNPDIPDDDPNVLWCYVEKERGRAPLVYPIVEKADQDD